MARPPRHPTSRASSVGAKIPAYWRGKLDRVLLPESRLKRRVTELAHQLETDYADRELVIVAILNGTLAAAVGLGLRLWIVGLGLWAVGHALAVWAARRDPQVIEVVRRHLRLPAHLAV